jgi:hypothetical protein
MLSGGRGGEIAFGYAGLASLRSQFWRVAKSSRCVRMPAKGGQVSQTAPEETKKPPEGGFLGGRGGEIRTHDI